MVSFGADDTEIGRQVPFVRVRSKTEPLPEGGRDFRRTSLLTVKAKADDHDERVEKIATEASIGTFFANSWLMLCGNRLYVLLVLVPFAIAAEEMGASTSMRFALSCAAILPLAGLLGDATEQVAMHTNDTLSGLLNATFGNATECIVAYFALSRGLTTVVQVSLLGSVLSNTLLVLGCACLAGGLRHSTPSFNRVAAVSNSTLLQIAILSLMVPGLLESVGNLKVHDAPSTCRSRAAPSPARPRLRRPALGLARLPSASLPQVYDAVDLQISRGISCALLILYVLYCVFQLFSHRHLFEEPPEQVTLTLTLTRTLTRTLTQLLSHRHLFEEPPEQVRPFPHLLPPSLPVSALL